jgi:CRP-like cAMP-binding protein
MQMIPISKHPKRAQLRKSLATNIILRSLSDSDFGVLEEMLLISEHKKGDVLINRGMHDMEQYFVIEGVLKRSVSNPDGKEMILRFTKEDDMETSYAAWRLRTPMPYSIAAVTRSVVAHLPLPQWVAFIEARPDLKSDFEYEVMFLMSEIMAHTITLHLLDAPGRLQRFERKHPDFLERVPKKELASYLNLSAETLSRLKHYPRD